MAAFFMAGGGGKEQRQKRLKAKAAWGKGGWGLGFRRARCLAGSVRRFRVFVSFAVARHFCTLVK